VLTKSIADLESAIAESEEGSAVLVMIATRRLQTGARRSRLLPLSKRQNSSRPSRISSITGVSAVIALVSDGYINVSPMCRVLRSQHTRLAKYKGFEA